MTDLVFHLAERGHQISVFTSRQDYNDPAANYQASDRVRNVRVRRCWSTAFGRAGLVGRGIDYVSFYMSVFWNVLRFAKNGDIVVATTDPPLLGPLVMLAVRLRGARLVNWLHDLFPEVATRSQVRGLGGWFARRLQAIRDNNCRQAAANVVLGTRMLDFLIERGVPVAKLTTIPNWAPAGICQWSEPSLPLRSEWQLAEKFVIAYAGNLGRVHEFETLLTAAQHLSKDSWFAFLFVGGGARMQGARQRVAELQLPNVSFQPYQPRDRLTESLSVADLHIVCLRPEFEALVVPSKLYGIAAVGRPAIFIGDERGEVATLIGTHEFGHTVACGDAQGLSDLIKKIAADTPGYQSMCTSAQRAHENHFAANHALARWEKLLLSL